MEFIRGLERALELGVSKEDYLKAWAAESSKTPLSEISRSLSTSRIKQIYPDVKRDDDVAKYDQLAHQLQQTKDELKADFRLMLQAMFSQHAQNEEQRWAQFKVQVARMEKEFQHQNEILCQHINNSIESQSTSLTSNFMKELEMLKHDVERIIDDRYIRQVTTSNSFATSSAINCSCHYGGTPIDPVRSRDHTCSLNDHNVAQAHEDGTCKWQATRESITNRSNPFRSENIPAPHVPVDRRKGNITSYEMNKWLTGSSASLLDDDKESVNSGDGITFYDDCDEFIIPDIDEFSSSHRTFVRKLTIQPEQFWRARLIVKFNVAGELKVELRVAEGQNESDSKWPLKFQGVGHIYNPCSRRFSEIWEITSTTFDKPKPDRYFVWPAKVSLSTTRDDYPDVTYEQLESKNYVDNDTLKFKWSLKVESA